MPTPDAGAGWLGPVFERPLITPSRPAMQNVLSLQPDRPRPQRALGPPRGGAQILLFTGVRYCREDDAPAPAPRPASAPRPSERVLDAAAH